MELPSVMNRPALVQTKTRLDSVSLLALAQLLLIVCVVALVIYRLSPYDAHSIEPFKGQAVRKRMENRR